MSKRKIILIILALLILGILFLFFKNQQKTDTRPDVTTADLGFTVESLGQSNQTENWIQIETLSGSLGMQSPAEPEAAASNNASDVQNPVISVELPQRPQTVTTAKKSKKGKKKSRQSRQPDTEKQTEITTIWKMMPQTEPANEIQTPKAKEPVTSAKKKKKTVVKTPKTTKKAAKTVVNNTVPSQSQSSGIIGSSNTALVKNTIMSNFVGTYDTNMQNLAIYMATNHLTNAQDTLKKLCKTTSLTVIGKTATATAASGKQEDILKAAEDLADSLQGSGRYGVGIRSEKSGNGYRITAVLVVNIVT